VLPFIAVQGRDMALLEWLGSVTRVRVGKGARDYVKGGCAAHCPEQHIHVVSETFRWSVTGAKATIVLMGVRAYVRLRPARFDELIELGLAQEWRPQTVKDMKDLGWPVIDRPLEKPQG
jgi:hypothetical protein